MDTIAVDLRDVEEALPVVREVARHTPLVPDPTHEGAFLKLENLQRLGAFKIRGTWNRLSRLSEADRRRGVATISSGNHGLSLAWAARRLGIPCRVFVPEGASPRKVDLIRKEGAEVAPMPRSELVHAHEAETWRMWLETFVHPFAHAHTVAGAGTIGLEIVDDLPEVRTVLVPVGGGGLASGIALAVNGLAPQAKVLGVQAEGAASLPEALRTGQPYRVADPKTIADGIRIGMVLPAMLPLLRRLDGCLLVSDGEITAAMRRLALEVKVVAEPAGAAAFAAYLRHRETLEPPVVCVVSGGNVETRLLADILQGP